MPKIPVWKTVIDAYWMPLLDIKGVFLNAWLPFVVIVGTGFVFGFLDAGISINPVVSNIGITLVSVIMVTYFTIAMHRRFLFGPGPDTGRLLWRFGAAERVFFGMVFIIFAIFALLGGALFVSDFNGAVAIVALVAVFLLLGVGVCVSLAFPAAADGRPHPIKFGWELTKGVRWRMAAIMLLAGVPLSIVNAAGRRAEESIVGGLVVAIFYYLTSAITVAALCIAYKTRTAGLDRDEAEPSAPPAEAEPSAT